MTPTRRWRDMTDAEAEAALERDPDLVLITDYLTGDLSPDERQQVQERRESDPAFAARMAPLAEVWQEAPVAEPVPRAKLEAMWRDVRERAGLRPLEDAPAPERRRTLVDRVRDSTRLQTISWRTGHAAFLAFLFWMTVATASDPNTMLLVQRLRGTLVMANAIGQPMQVTLADGTVLRIGPRSSLRYPADWADRSERVIRLDGEGEFEITHRSGGRVVVRAGALEAIVVGTRFRVMSWPSGAAEVTVVEGVVQVRSVARRGAMLELRAGERAHVEPGEAPRKVER